MKTQNSKLGSADSPEAKTQNSKFKTQTVLIFAAIPTLAESLWDRLRTRP
jgi:hypothetical protein